jgi:hypothetical protein
MASSVARPKASSTEGSTKRSARRIAAPAPPCSRAPSQRTFSGIPRTTSGLIIGPTEPELDRTIAEHAGRPQNAYSLSVRDLSDEAANRELGARRFLSLVRRVEVGERKASIRAVSIDMSGEYQRAIREAVRTPRSALTRGTSAGSRRGPPTSAATSGKPTSCLWTL